jgi:hypothetical protein
VALQEELEKGVPRWSHVHTVVGSAVFGWVAFLGTVLFIRAMSVLVPGEMKVSDDEFTAQGYCFLLLYVVTIIFFVNKHSVVREWFFPRLEIVRHDGARTSVRRLAFLGAICVEFMVGIAVNSVS